MRILSLRGSFGCLQNETLQLQEGLNILELPNEGGKSTWSAFLLAMFYGVDTSERASRGVLPVKTRYKPWSGAPMEGSMELEWRGRRITIERSSTGRSPLGVFRAYETESGLAVPELTAENCGRTLLGVERSVYERSAFIRQAGLAVSQDSALESRLHSLVTTGDEQLSYSAAEHTLRDRWNRLARAHTGRAAAVAEELAALRSRRTQLDALSREDYALRAQRAALQQEQAQLSQRQATARAQQAAQKLQQLQAADEALAQCRSAMEAAEQAAAAIPENAALDAVEQLLDQLPARPQQPIEQPPATPVPPEALRGLEDEAIRAQLEQDLSDFDAPERVQQPPLWPLLLALALAVAGLALLFVLLPVGLLLIACGLLLTLWSSRKKRAAAEEERAALHLRTEVQCRYGSTSRDEIVRSAESYRSAQAAYQAQNALYAQHLQAYRQAEASYQCALQALLSQCSGLTTETSPPQIRAALARARHLRAALERARTAFEQARQYSESLHSAYGAVQPPAPSELGSSAEAIDPLSTERQLADCTARLNRINSQLDLHRGQASALGDPAQLDAEIEALQEQQLSLQLHASALETALQALHAANDEVQTRISPAINQQAGELMQRLTGGRYDKVLLDASFTALARRSGESVQRALGYLSAGTADQLYLALRLAICALALPAEDSPPLVLDDALVTFDDARCRSALQLLQELSARRQILLLTCQSREARLLEQAQ